MASPAVLVNGALVAPERATISVYDRGFVYGDGVFETMRTYGGQAFALADHLRRLAASADALHIAMPCSPEDLARETREAIRAAALRSTEEAVVRIAVTRGPHRAGLDLPARSTPTRVIYADPFSPPDEGIYVRGVAVKAVRAHRAADFVPHAKVMSYVGAMLAREAARREGAYEALLLSDDGRILEGATSSFFLVVDGALVTPPDGDILAGVTAAHVMECAKDLGISVIRRAVHAADVRAAGEAFLTSTLREVVPVVRVDGVGVGDGRVGALARALLAAFRARASAFAAV